MSVSLQFYLERAAQSEREAAEATLDNVRDRCLRAEAAWRGMATRVERAQRGREDDVAARQIDAVIA